MPEIVAYPTAPFRLGGRVYLRGERMTGLSPEEFEFYKRRGVVNDKPGKGANLTRIASTPVAPMSTEDMPKPATPPTPPTTPPAEQQPQQTPAVPEQNAVADAARQLAERSRLAAEKITGKRGK